MGPALKTSRAFLVGIVSAALVGLPGAAALAGPPSDSSANLAPASINLAVSRHRTSIRFLDFDHFRAAGSGAVVRGQVVGWANGDHGALGGVQVKLFRQLDGNSNWVFLGSRVTDRGDFPRFSFSTEARQNAHYKVVFGGNASFLPSQDVNWLSIYRSFNGSIVDGSDVATLQGHVTPYYTHKAIALQKRSCATCAYVTVKRTTTGTGGAYSYSLPAPASGRWWWRVSIPGTTAFIPSYGATFSTEQR